MAYVPVISLKWVWPDLVPVKKMWPMGLCITVEECFFRHSKRGVVCVPVNPNKEFSACQLQWTRCGLCVSILVM